MFSMFTSSAEATINSLVLCMYLKFAKKPFACQSLLHLCIHSLAVDVTGKISYLIVRIYTLKAHIVRKRSTHFFITKIFLKP